MADLCVSAPYDCVQLLLVCYEKPVTHAEYIHMLFSCSLRVSTQPHSIAGDRRRRGRLAECGCATYSCRQRPYNLQAISETA